MILPAAILRDFLEPVFAREVTPGQFITPQHYVAWKRRKPMRHLKARRGAVPQKYRDIVFKHDNYRCVHCGARSGLTFGHIVPWIFGGSNEPSNGRTECLPCNVRQWTPELASLVEDATCRRDGTVPEWARAAARHNGSDPFTHFDPDVD